MNAYRAQLLRFDTDGTPLYESDGLLVVGLAPMACSASSTPGRTAPLPRATRRWR